MPGFLLLYELSYCCAHTHTHTYTHYCTHTHSHVCTNTHTHMYTHTPTHTHTHTHSCLKPNSVKKPDHFDPAYITAQLRYTGIMETTRIRRCGFPSRLTFEDFLKW